MKNDEEWGENDFGATLSTTVLHMAVLRNLPSIIDIVLKYRPELLYFTSRCLPKMPQMIPLKAALEKRNDEAASILISRTISYRYVNQSQWAKLAKKQSEGVRFC